jgi:hypothetical protein
MVNWKGCEGKQSLPISKYSSIILKVLRKRTKNLNHENRCTNLDSNPAPSEYKRRVVVPNNFFDMSPLNSPPPPVIIYRTVCTRIYIVVYDQQSVLCPNCEQKIKIFKIKIFHGALWRLKVPTNARNAISLIFFSNA